MALKWRGPLLQLWHKREGICGAVNRFISMTRGLSGVSPDGIYFPREVGYAATY